jgi:protein-glucosylgalactosylhydroxylysine glucosidase
VTETRRGLEIRDVCGIAERQPPVNNNAYVNLATPLGHEANPIWARTEQRVVVPLDRRTNVIRNHDAYRINEEKGETPEGAGALFPLGYACPPEVERATFEFGLSLADRYGGPPMLSSQLGVFGARVGDRKRALEFFERGYAAFVKEPYSVTLEYDPTVFPDQPRAALYGKSRGFLMSCLYGLTGLRLTSKPPGEWCERPIALPQGRNAIEVERVWVRGVPVRLEARHGDDCARLEFKRVSMRRIRRA